MRIIILLLAFTLSFNVNAQSFSDGVYNTNYGTITLTFEQGIEYPNGGMAYGDYRDNGTITGTLSNKAKHIIGSFHNGAAEGKFIFFSPMGKLHFYDHGITSFEGNWGYDNDNRYSLDPNYIWKVTSKTGGRDAVKNVTNVWSGKWNTTHGYIILEQVGNKVTGKYNEVGNIDATYNPSSRKLTGTFTNNANVGFLEFTFEGNSFKGKWGWSRALTGGDWNGDKHVKNNKEIAAPTTSSTTSSTGSSNTSNTATTKYTVRAVNISTAQSNIYGFFGFKLFKVTQGGRVQVPNFGNKPSDVYNETENSSKVIKSSSYNFPNSPEFYREFIIPNADLNNPNIKYELEVYVHVKNKVLGSNTDYGYTKEIYRLDNVEFNKNIRIGLTQQNHTLVAPYIGSFEFKIVKQ
jgi:hypothetical protein